MHLNTAFTDTQREKMAGASIDVQKRIYLTGFQARHLRGLEEVVTFEGIENVLTRKIEGGKNTGKEAKNAAGKKRVLPRGKVIKKDLR